MKYEINKPGVVAPERSGGVTTPGLSYDGEAKPRRRSFPLSFRKQILDEIDNCHVRGSIGLILRREGLYASQIAQWRKALKSKNKKEQKKPLSTDPKNEIARLNREVARLKAKLENANMLIEIQKKMAEFAEQLAEENTESNPAESSKNISEI